MDILVVGGGGREHAIIKKLKESSQVSQIYALPGNGGIAADAKCIAIDAKDIEGIAAFAVEKKIDFAVIAPDDPLVLGAVDKLYELGIPCFGPNAAAAQIEGSKTFAKELMLKYAIPTAQYAAFTDAAEADAYLERASYPLVIKANGLALGKGVFIIEDKESAKETIKSILVDKIFGASGDKLIIEEFLTGPEVSVLAFTDGQTLVPMISSMDHKRALDNDLGLNTGGMGTVAPNPYYTEQIADQCMKDIFTPTIQAMAKEGCPFKGCLYFGLMLTDNGPKVIEYNCRFGDPETQVVLPLLESDLLEIMIAVEEERLGDMDICFSTGATCCVVMASDGYPTKYETGYPVTDNSDDALVYHAGTKADGNRVLTSGGRVLGVTAVGETLAQAIDKAYAAVKKITFKNEYYRKDIGQKAMKAVKK